MEAAKAFTMVEIGKIVKEVSGNCIEISDEYRQGLKELEKYSHLHVYWWASEFDDEEHRRVLVTDIPYAEEEVYAGVFACRSPERPNLIMDSICVIKGINEKKGKIFIENIDASPHTPVVDIKPYIPVVDRVKSCRVPAWFPREWGEWLPRGGVG